MSDIPENGGFTTASGPIPPAPEKKPKQKKKWPGILALILVCLILGGIAGVSGMNWINERKAAKAEEPQKTESAVDRAVGFVKDKLGRGKDEAEAEPAPEAEAPVAAPEAPAPKAPEKEPEAPKAEEPKEEKKADGTGILMGRREDSKLDITEIDTGKQLTAAEVYAINVNSTVGITVGVTYNYWGYTGASTASGSGFIISEDGYILTNNHVVEDANSVTVTCYDGTVYEAEVVGCDESSDIAVLKVDAEDLVPVVFGDSDNMNVGDTVIAIGNPLGELTFSLTQGVISALGREVTFSNGTAMNLIQTDCAINSGNSGGALFNLYGEVIGITNAKYSSSSYSSAASIDNIGFAIPVNGIMDVVESLIEKGYVSKPYLGVYITTVDETSQGYGIPGGAAIVSLVEGGPADKAGLQANDIITAVNGEEIATASDLTAAISACEPGDKLTVTVYRKSETLEIKVTLGEKADYETEEPEPEPQTQQQPLPQGGSGWSNGDIWDYFFGG